MKELQEWCKKILPVVQAAANGEEIEVCVYGKWVEAKASAMSSSNEYRIKPRTIKIGDIEVPEPITKHPDEMVTHVYVASPAASGFYDEMELDQSKESYVFAERGICHKTKDAAIAHARALIALTAK